MNIISLGILQLCTLLENLQRDWEERRRLDDTNIISLGVIQLCTLLENLRRGGEERRRLDDTNIKQTWCNIAVHIARKPTVGRGII